MDNIAIDGNSIKQPIDIFFDIFSFNTKCPLNEGSTKIFTMKLMVFMTFLTVIQLSFKTLQFSKIGISIVTYMLAIIMIAKYIKLLNNKVISHQFIGIFGILSILLIIIIILALLI